MYSVMEGVDPSVTLTVFRTGNIDLPANVTFSTVPGTADGIYKITWCEYEPFSSYLQLLTFHPLLQLWSLHLEK